MVHCSFPILRRRLFRRPNKGRSARALRVVGWSFAPILPSWKVGRHKSLQRPKRGRPSAQSCTRSRIPQRSTQLNTSAPVTTFINACAKIHGLCQRQTTKSWASKSTRILPGTDRSRRPRMRSTAHSPLYHRASFFPGQGGPIFPILGDLNDPRVVQFQSVLAQDE